ncbi:MAG: hydrogenase maturation factor HypF (carbamoyltransferase family) [Mariniflexile sp.]|jgi:hydrogenase maturation factor HypF (carbamoyltransferase family)
MVFGHDFKVTRNVTYHVKEYSCKNCKKQLTTSGNGNLIELTSKFREINDVLERIHHNRISKTSRQKIKSSLLVFSH